MEAALIWSSCQAIRVSNRHGILKAKREIITGAASRTILLHKIQQFLNQILMKRVAILKILNYP